MKKYMMGSESKEQLNDLKVPLLDEEAQKEAVQDEAKVQSKETSTVGAAPVSTVIRILAALFYAFASFSIMVVNKNVLTANKFPSFQMLGFGQMFATVVVLHVLRALGIVSFPRLERDTFRKIWPLPLFYIGNMIFGLGGTKELSLPMLTVLRRFSILMTMVGEFYILNIKPRLSVQLSVYLMIFGAVVAAVNDLTFNLKGYILICLNNICTAANGVFFKKKLESKDLGKYGLMYYNSLFMLFPSLVLADLTGEVEKTLSFEGWSNPVFVFQFLLSCIFGFILMWSIAICTHYNSPLTTTIVGCLKNILITYMGMFLYTDYIFSWPNFIGLNISVIGSLIYTKVTFSAKSQSSTSKRTTTLPTTKGASNA